MYYCELTFLKKCLKLVKPFQNNTLIKTFHITILRYSFTTFIHKKVFTSWSRPIIHFFFWLELHHLLRVLSFWRIEGLCEIFVVFFQRSTFPRFGVIWVFQQLKGKSVARRVTLPIHKSRGPSSGGGRRN